MKIRYTLHALERMKQRSISRSEVEQCISRPDRDEKVNDERRCVKRLNHRALIVIYWSGNDTIVIVTAFVTSKLHKYLG